MRQFHERGVEDDALRAANLADRFDRAVTRCLTDRAHKAHGARRVGRSVEAGKAGGVRLHVWPQGRGAQAWSLRLKVQALYESNEWRKKPSCARPCDPESPPLAEENGIQHR